MIINVAVLLVVLESDLGRKRKITRFRVVRPIISALLIVPFFIKGFVGGGWGLIIELALAAAGVLLGLVATSRMRVYRSPETGKPVTSAGLGYAAVWIGVIGARAAFSYGSVHWFGPQLGRWMTEHAVTSAAITDGLIFMAVGMLVTRVLAMIVRANRLAAAPSRREFGVAPAVVR